MTLRDAILRSKEDGSVVRRPHWIAGRGYVYDDGVMRRSIDGEVQGGAPETHWLCLALIADDWECVK